MRTVLLALLSTLLVAGAAHGESVVLGLSSDKVAITTSFDGSDILIFGAVKRDRPIPPGPPLQVVITVAGPPQKATVRRKSEWNHIWINTASVEVDSAPSFYAVATTAPLQKVVTATEDLRRKISIGHVVRSVGAPDEIGDAASFTKALIRIRERQGLYQELEGGVALDEQTLFRTAIRLPANLVEGTYKTRIFLTRDRRIVSSYETAIDVRKVGLERWLYALAHSHGALYGLMSLAIAIGAGWAASAAFRLVRNS